ncbi:MAG: topoisomerase DNA-binding C4 zinc finger domain-containing protein, partial [Calditrichaeota bacterium]|nr:topoisomerase DNA-binding C4 zinc finger domain-containing protein [Calditrichota bacterium]
HREGKQFRPTELGVMINDMLIQQFPTLFSESFTASMEEDLDQIAEGGVEWQDMLTSFYSQLSGQIETAKEHMQDLKKDGMPTDYKCEECGSDMVVKWGRNGQFLACTNYPDCKNTKEVRIDVMGKITVEEPEKVEKPCPECGSELMVKRGRFGKFLACTNYPDCSGTERWATSMAFVHLKNARLTDN